MRRRPHLTAALGAGAIVLLTSGVVVGSLASVPRAAAVTVDESTRVPEDLAWVWLQHCELSTAADLGTAVGWYSFDEDGAMSVEYGTVDEDGLLVVDEGLTHVVGACVGERRVEPWGGTRVASDAERVEIYDWAVRWQRPCLAAHGFDVPVPRLRDFLDPQLAPWDLLLQGLWTGGRNPAEIDFDLLLEARLACPTVPPALAGDGVA